MTPLLDTQRAQTMNDMSFASDETLVEDRRGGLRPCQQVERKLVSVVGSVPLHLGQLQSSRPRRPQS